MIDKNKTLTDVEKPGTTPAHATSRPIIISKTPVVKDPMVSNDEPMGAEPVRLPPSAAKKTIAPLSAADKEPETPTDSEPTDKIVDKPEEADSKEEALPIEAETDQSPEEIAAAAQAVLSKEEQQQAELVEKLVEQKKYFVPIGAVQKRRTARNTALLAFVLLVLVGAALAVDAGIIKTEFTLPFDLIKN